MSDLNLVDQGLVYDWNTIGKIQIPKGRKVMLDDETLRDGLQNPSVRNPTLSEKIEILHLMENLGIDTVTVGLPGAGDKAAEQSFVLTQEIVKSKMKIAPLCAARTHENDILPVVRISERIGAPVPIGMFIGTSPIRRLAEDWNMDHLLCTTEKAVRLAVSYGLPVLYATEDTTRSSPETIKQLYTCAIECGARAIALCDTVGHATPIGAYNLVKFAVEQIVKPSGEQVRIDWHGHRDRDLAIANSLAAILAGADQIHAAANSLGERVGNTPVELMLVNLKLLGLIDRDLSCLKKYCETVARATGTTIPPNYPVFGCDAFRTGSGIHAAAIIKAYKKNDPMLANMIYSGVPSHLFGLEQTIEIGPMSGRSSVVYWLEKRGIPATDDLVGRIFEAAKTADSILTEDEIRAIGGVSMADAVQESFTQQ
jgi:2-isopropylmalate synthase